MTAPLRTCVGCRRVEPQAALLRVALSGPGDADRARAIPVIVDERRRAPGRGAWVHPRPACLQNAARGGLRRSFRRAIDPAALLVWAERSKTGLRGPGATSLGARNGTGLGTVATSADDDLSTSHRGGEVVETSSTRARPE